MRPSLVPPLTVGASALMLAAAAQAQVYRVVGPDGRVTYSDTPPAAQAPAPAQDAAAPRGGSPGLPYQLGQTAQRYPVTLYTASQCAPCTSGRNLLVNRGVPFAEKTIESGGDVAALQRLVGGGDLPLLTIGAQHLKGFSDAEWSQYLDAAGYPRTSQLPSTWRRAPASPLVPARATPAAAASVPAPAAPEAPSAELPHTPTNPAGIRF